MIGATQSILPERGLTERGQTAAKRDNLFCRYAPNRWRVDHLVNFSRSRRERLGVLGPRRLVQNNFILSLRSKPLASRSSGQAPDANRIGVLGIGRFNSTQDYRLR